MSLSRSPSPARGGGWSSPGLTAPYNGSGGRSSPAVRTFPNGGATWASSQARSAEVKGNPSFSTRKQGFFSKHIRKISRSLSSVPYAEKEKLGRGRSRMARSRLGRVWSLIETTAWRFRFRFGILLVFLLGVVLFYITPLHLVARRSSYLGGGNKFVIILAANMGGGVMEWKGATDWAIERDSIENKQKYAKKWGYNLEIVDMSTKKRYAHEWRESWEKVDLIKSAMRKYPEAEWFWWLDLNTFIMEPSYSLQSHLFNNLAKNTYRDINHYNPLNITHPLTAEYLDDEARSAEGDGKAESIHLVLPQDCSGFNLGSFFVHRSVWTDRLLDIWWDPVGYEQKHMEWEHKEQDALESMYINHPWVRPHVAFVSQRKINSFPPGACSDDGVDAKIHYQQEDRDFLVNMAGCEWGRDCWAEMYSYRQLSNRLNLSMRQRFLGWITGSTSTKKSDKKTEMPLKRKE